MINKVYQINSNSTAFRPNKAVSNFDRHNESQQDVCTSSETLKKASQENKLYIPYKENYISFLGSGYEFELKKQKDLPCPCCGKKMITVEEQKAFANYMEKATGEDLIKGIEKYYDRLPGTEQKVCDVLMDSAETYPNDTIKNLLKKQRVQSLKNLEEKQQKILKDISHTIRNLKGEIGINTRQSLEGVSKKLDLTTFYKDEAKAFISEVSNSIEKENDLGNKEILEKVLQKARKLPLPSTDKDSFIVIFSRDTDKDIALRLISPATISVEHVIPISQGGTDSDWNKMLFCKSCNNNRALSSYIELLEECPEMVDNTIEHFDEIMRRIISGEIKGYDLYPMNIGRTLSDVTGGAISIDTSMLRKPKKIKKANMQVLSRALRSI